MPSHGHFDYVDKTRMKTYLKNTLMKLDMDDPIELNKHIIAAEEERKRLESEQVEEVAPVVDAAKDIFKNESDGDSVEIWT